MEKILGKNSEKKFWKKNSVSPMTFDYLSDDNDDLQPGATALWLAAARGHALCVQLLLAHQSIDTNQPDQSGLTPLDIAKKNNHLLCVELLTSTTIRK